MSHLRTVNCVFCGKEATAYIGHVHRPFTNDDDTMLAGVCEECWETVIDNEDNGVQYKCLFRPDCNSNCYGNWQPWHGVREIRHVDDLDL